MFKKSSRILILAEKRLPQDGQFNWSYQKKQLFNTCLRHFLLYMEKKIVPRLMNNLQQPYN